MKKALCTATVVKTHILTFHIPCLKVWKEMGWHTSVAAKNDCWPEACEIPFCDCFTNIDFVRAPFHPGNISACRKLKTLMEKERFDLIHCHTPVAAVLTRLAAAGARKRYGTKIFYTAHGLHFYRGAPLRNWLFYPVEKLCARFTDVLITINREDYALAQKRLKAKKVVYIPGVGIDLSRFAGPMPDREEKRKELDIPAGGKLLLSVGELTENKNHETLIRGVAKTDGVYLLIAGDGARREKLLRLIRELGMDGRIRLLGYRRDVPELCRAADAFALASRREGLSLSVMEAMAAGLPCAVSRIRGNTDLIDENGGMLFDPGSVEDCAGAIERVLRADRAAMGRYNAEKVKAYELGTVMERMRKLYEDEVN